MFIVRFAFLLLVSSYAFADVISIATGNISGIYYPTGVALCRIINMDSAFEGSRCTVTSSHGSRENMGFIVSKSDNFALAQENEIANFEKNTDLMGVLSLHTESLIIIARQDANIVSLKSDLKGKKINVGLEGSGLYTITMDTIKASGADLSIVGGIVQIPQVDVEEAFCSGAIDATAIIAGHPNKVIQRMTERCNGKIVRIASDVLDNMAAKYKSYIVSRIPGGMYYGEDADISTIGTNAMIVTNASENNEIVYNFVKAIYQNFDSIKTSSAVMSSIDKSAIVPDSQVIPIHPGARKYFEENGMIKILQNSEGQNI